MSKLLLCRQPDSMLTLRSVLLELRKERPISLMSAKSLVSLMGATSSIASSMMTVLQ